MARGKSRTARLCELAEACGFSADSLAKATGLDRSTIHHHWDQEDWLEKMRSDTLRHLVGYVTGLAELLNDSAVEDRRLRLVSKFGGLGLPLDEAAFKAVVAARIVPAQKLCNALDAVFYMAQGSVAEAEGMLRCCWGRDETRALDLALGIGTDVRLLPEQDRLIDAAEAMLEDLLARPRKTFDTVFPLTVLAHHVAKAKGDVAPYDTFAGRPRKVDTDKTAFLTRGAYMGVIRQADDMDAVDAYDHLVSNSGVLRGIEQWAFPTWASDTKLGRNFRLPAQSVKLVKTGQEVVREVQEYNDAYVGYLARTFIPIALNDVDPEFGGHLPELHDALVARSETARLTEVVKATFELANEIEHNAPIE